MSPSRKISSFDSLTFFQVATASRLDGSRERIRMLPFLLLGFLVSTLSVARASLSRASWMRGRPVEWHKTERFRTARVGKGPAAPKGGG